MKVGAVVAVAAVSMGALGVWSATAGAAIAPLPTFPDNLAVFPNRDFITVEGFADHVGDSALIEVVRPGIGVVGSAVGVVSGGDVAFEVNHPGGYCWGEGTTLKVTPDIQGGDEVTINFDGGPVEYSVTTNSTAVTVPAYLDPRDPLGTTMLVEGYIEPTTPDDRFEQRIIEPVLRDTEIQRRDIRALFGPLAPDNFNSYLSGVTRTAPDHWVATYVFQNASTAIIARDAALGERAMSWQFTDPAANRQGITLAEFGEPGGPGMGGCPNGPLQSGPPAPNSIKATIINGGGAIQVDWVPPTPIPGTPAIDGYRVTAVGAVAGGEKVELGKSITNPAATSTIISGFGTNGVAAASTFDVEMVSLSTAGYTFPAAHAIPAVDTTAPVVSASALSGSFASPFDLTLTADDPNAQIYYTLNDTSPIDGSGSVATLSPAAKLFTAPIPVTGPTTVQFVAFDVFGNVSAVGKVNYVITNDPAALAPTSVTVSPGVGTLKVDWTAVPDTILNYEVRVYDAVNATAPVASVETAGGILTATVPGLVSAQPYWVSVAAKNSLNPIYGVESARISTTTLGVVANAGPDKVTTNRPETVTLTGSGTAGATYQWTQVANEAGDPFPPLDVVKINTPTLLTTTVSIPVYTSGQTVGPRFFKLTVTKAGSGTASDIVKVTPVVDPIGITTAKWKVNDFRIVGSGGIEGATITVYNATTGQSVGSATVVLGAWDVRQRVTQQVVTQVYAISNKGGRTANFIVATR